MQYTNNLWAYKHSTKIFAHASCSSGCKYATVGSYTMSFFQPSHGAAQTHLVSRTRDVILLNWLHGCLPFYLSLHPSLCLCVLSSVRLSALILCYVWLRFCLRLISPNDEADPFGCLGRIRWIRSARCLEYFGRLAMTLDVTLLQVPASNSPFCYLCHPHTVIIYTNKWWCWQSLIIIKL